MPYYTRDLSSRTDVFWSSSDFLGEPAYVGTAEYPRWKSPCDLENEICPQGLTHEFSTYGLENKNMENENK